MLIDPRPISAADRTVDTSRTGGEEDSRRSQRDRVLRPRWLDGPTLATIRRPRDARAHEATPGSRDRIGHDLVGGIRKIGLQLEAAARVAALEHAPVVRAHE